MKPEPVAWCKAPFDLIADGGIWAVPRSGLVFTKRGDGLVLTETLPHMEGMPVSPAELADYQESEFDDTRRHFGAAGIEVRRG
jgi:hypothetical protein